MVFLWLSFITGTLHAAASFYWASGGQWLLESVGQWAVDAVRDNPTFAMIGLGVTGAGKLIAATLPILYAHGVIPPWRIWLPLFWLGAAGLVIYGGANVVTGAMVLSGLIAPEGGYNAEAIFGHTVIWGPLFLLWGIFLGIWLWRSHFAGRKPGTPQRA